MSDLALPVRQAQDDELFNALGEASARVFVSQAFTPFALAVAAQRYAAGRTALIVASDDTAARDLAADLQVYLPDRSVRPYPARGVLYESHLEPPPHLVGLRIAALDSITAAGSDAIIVVSAGALAERVPDPALRPHGFELEQGGVADLDELARDLVASGYERVDRVEDRGQFATRGDILDVFPATGDNAVRVEFFDIEIESLRRFSTFTQRSLESVEHVEIEPATELAAEYREDASQALADRDEDDETHPADIAELLPIDRFHALLDLAPDDAWLAVAGREDVEAALGELWADVEATYRDASGHGLYVPPEELLEQVEKDADLTISNLSVEAGTPELRAERPASMARSFEAAEIEIEKLQRSGYRTIIAWTRKSERERAQYNLARVKPQNLAESDEVREWSGVFFTQQSLREGFVSPALKLAVIPDRLLMRTAGRSAAAQTSTRGRIANFADLAVGDIVVHEDHGIARFDGFDTKSVAGITRDYLTLLYRGDDKVFLPADQLHKISRYFGAAGPEGVNLSKLGGKAWENLKTRARKAAHELAGELINLYAARRRAIGFRFSPDNEMQMQFEGAFPYQETRDQLDAIERVKEGMESPQPMDILICGDVGFGKTEVALRAAFKAVQDSKQVMVLAPTTILTQQHFGTFSERMRDFPITVDFVSRFRSKAEQKETLKQFEEGAVDILIGTHRLLSADVRPKDLGLIVVDEEQRFGVKQKELLRQLRVQTDVISLSATPIPRTLQMSMAGMREIAVIATPPEGRRPVRTHVGEWDEEVVKQALTREHERGGQSLYMHDLVGTIDETADRIRALMPELKVDVVHGQLDEHTLEERMMGFIRGEYECLVCTTIVESGLDIPSANTLIVERADKLGLSQAYQIRGRVGRGRERAFAYFLYPGAEALSQVAASRLSTLADHTELGSGFKVAMRDLEIRGAGNLLGEEQSGHIAAVGFDLYVSMIDAAVAELEGRDDSGEHEPVRLDVTVDAYVPSEYVMYEQAKIELHRRIAGARELADIGSLREELKDRFGPVPEPLERLMQLQEARLKFGRCGARTVGFTQGRLVVAPLTLNAEQVAVIREDLPTAIYDRGQRTIAMRVDGEPEEQFAVLSGLADALVGATGSVPEPV
ncbi:MAG: transcription-repair coupling factor [Thermoleophilaceae bacterium]|nr:transcription-repair coupling factor [Thermoleophilaceae bacterium]